MTTTQQLTRGETFTHHVPQGWASYQFQWLYFGDEVVGVLVDGEPHALCKRCGMGEGHYMWNSADENDICYQCLGEGYGEPIDEATLLRRAVKRQQAAERRMCKAQQERERAEAAYAAWIAERTDWLPVLEGFLPKLDPDAERWEDVLGPGPHRLPARTFIEKMAVQVFDYRDPLTEKQEAAVRDAIAHKQERDAERVAAGHWGTEGKRAEATVTVVGVRSFDSDYGTRWLVTLKTAEGHLLKTWTSGSFVDTAIDRHNDGEPVKVKATVKTHGYYNGLPETTVTRVAAI